MSAPIRTRSVSRARADNVVRVSKQGRRPRRRTAGGVEGPDRPIAQLFDGLHGRGILGPAGALGLQLYPKVQRAFTRLHQLRLLARLSRDLLGSQP